MKKHFSKLFSAVMILMLVLPAFPSQMAYAVSPDIVISQVYGGGGNSGATLTNDFIELFNRGTSPASLAGWSVQYTSATGTGNFGANSGQLTELPSISLAPGQYLLIQEAAGSGGTTALPTPDVTDLTPINMSGASGKVALVNSTSGLGCNGSSTPCDATQLAMIIDLVGYGGANFFEGSPAPGLTNSTAALRASNGCTETDNNSADFTADTPNPRNTGSPLNPCGVSGAPEVIITEIMYDPNSAEDDWEWIEIYNAGTATADLTGYVVDDFNSAAHSSANIAGGTLAAGEQAVLYNADDVSASDFAAAWGTVNLLPVTGWSVLALNNGGDQVSLWDSFASYSGDNAAHANAIDTVNYAGAGFTDPVGASIYLIDLSADNNVGSNWATSTDGGATPLFESYTSEAAGGNVGGEIGSPGTPIAPIPPMIINEINADPDAANGDANGDGVVNTSQDEFVEIVNDSGAAVDISGWTLNDAVGVRHTFPAGSVVPVECAVVVFGGGSPVGSFGGSVVQTASTGLVGFNNGGDTVTLNNGTEDVASYTYGSEGGDNQSLTRDPDVTGADPLVKHTLATGSSGTLFSPGTKVDGSAFGGCDTSEAPDVFINELRIGLTGSPDADFFEIQGSVGTDLSGLTYVVISGEFEPGSIDYAIDLTGSTIPADGFFVAGGSNTASAYGIVPDLSVEFDFFGSPTTHMIVSNFTGNSSDDLDTNNDGTLDITPWTTVVDSVSLVDGDGTTDYSYSSAIVGPDGNFTPAGTYRCDDAPTGSFNNNQLAFDSLEGTPGESNASLCILPVTKIHDVQGAGAASPLDGQTVAIEGIVVGDFQDGASGVNGDLNGFHVQEEDADADANALTSEGVFVFDGSSPAVNVEIGDLVRVEGTVSEFNGLTEITSFSGVSVLSSGNALPAATNLSLPLTNVDDFEAFEGMYVTFPEALVISEYFNFDRFNETVLTSERHLTPTAEYEPGSLDQQQAVQDFLLDRITLDDGLTVQNPDPAIHPNGAEFTLANRFRGGDTVANVTGIMHYAFDLYRIQPTQGADYTSENPRTATPDDVGGNVTVASFNVLNYFTTLDDSSCPYSGGCRGADNAEEFTRQRAKIIAALTEIDADVVGLIEIENHPGDVPTADLVSGLNDVLGAGTYEYLATGAIGTDAIRVAYIYKPASVSLIGDYAVLDTSVDPRFLDDFNRPVLAQTFMDNATGGVFTVAVNHLKSKGSDCNAIGDPDTGDGAGNCNLTRKAAAEALVDWLAADPTGSGDEDFLIIGDLNSYDKEDPIDAILEGSDDTLGTDDDYTDLVYSFLGEDAYSYVFDGQVGYLDHALANEGLLDEVTGVTIWHINADEPDLIDYDTSFKQDAQDAIYAPDAYRSSDHDPVIIGLDVCDEIAPVFTEVSLNPGMLWPPNHKYVDVTATVTVSDNFDPDPTISLVSVTSNEPDNAPGPEDGNTVNDIVIVDDFHFKLRAERSEIGAGRIYTLTYMVTDDCGNSSTVIVYVTVPLTQGQ